MIVIKGDGFGHRWGWPKGPGPTKAGMFPATFYVQECGRVRELSIFVDESGDFGDYEPHSPFYLLTLVFHDQSVDISHNLQMLREVIIQRELPDHTVHAGPLIRREREYKVFTGRERKKIFDSLFHFVRITDITYHTTIVEKKQLVREGDLTARIAKQLSALFREHLETFTGFDRVIVYYDYGQHGITTILISVFSVFLNNVEFRKIAPAKYKLFQIADMLCTLELLAAKAERKALSKSELAFFKSAKDLHKSYLRAVQKKRFK